VSAGTGIALFIAAIFVMIVVHEFGHYSTARAFGIKVEQFFIGFGPKIFSWRRGETEYGLKGILLGGYVRIAGMNPWEPIPEEERPRTFGAKPAWQRAIVLVAGSATHLIMGFVILFLVFAFVGLPGATNTTFAKVSNEVGSSRRPSPAYQAGLREGDKVVQVDGEPIGSWDEFRQIVRRSAGRPLALVVERDGQQRTVTVTPMAGPDPEGGSEPVGLIGITPAAEIEKLPVGKAFVSAVTGTGRAVKISVSNIGRVFSPSGVKKVVADLGGKGERDSSSVTGLIGGGRAAGQAAEAGYMGYLFLNFAGFIVFVGIINLLPLPPLDGGHLVLLLIEKIRGRPVDMKKVVPVAAAVLTFFLLFTVALVYLDIARPVSSPF
jgi:membrane-associated protease RseP (regulator of RpoE activity)